MVWFYPNFWSIYPDFHPFYPDIYPFYPNSNPLYPNFRVNSCKVCVLHPPFFALFRRFLLEFESKERKPKQKCRYLLDPWYWEKMLFHECVIWNWMMCCWRIVTEKWDFVACPQKCEEKNWCKNWRKILTSLQSTLYSCSSVGLLSFRVQTKGIFLLNIFFSLLVPINSGVAWFFCTNCPNFSVTWRSTEENWSIIK